MYNNIIFEVKNNIAYVKVNRPKSLNALNTEVLTELLSAFKTVQEDDEIRSAILTGEGKAFVAGADIAQMRDLNTMEGRDMTIQGQKVMEYIQNIDKPVIAAVNGFALGGGCELAMACDIIFASEKAKFGQPEVNLGIIPGYGGTQRLSRIVGEKNAKYLIFSAEMIDAEEAHRMGLVQKVTEADQLLDDATKYAELIMSKAPIGLKMAKAAINNGLNMDLKSGVAFEAESYVSTFASDDRVEGMSAFLEKRAADFKNK